MLEDTVGTAVGVSIVPAICTDWAARILIIEAIDDVRSYALVCIAGTASAAVCKSET